METIKRLLPVLLMILVLLALVLYDGGNSASGRTVGTIFCLLNAGRLR